MTEIRDIFVVTGWRGMIGSALQKCCMDAGAGFIGIGRENLLLPSEIPEITPRIVRYDSIEHLREIIEGHIASIKSTRISFINTAWAGLSSLVDGGLATQFKNVSVSAEYAGLAKQLGASVFVQVGTSHELSLNTNKPADFESLPAAHQQYTIAKAAARDITAYRCYLEKLNHITVRFSIAVPKKICKNPRGFVQRSMRSILDCREPQPVTSRNYFNIASDVEIARQILTLAVTNVNGEEYFLGNGEAATLGDYFSIFKQIKQGDVPRRTETADLNERDFPSIKKIEQHTGYRCEETFSSLCKEIIENSHV